MDFTEDQILIAVYNAVQAETLLYRTDEHENLIGMILAEKRPDNVLFVAQNLAMNLATLKIFAAEAKKRWPELKLEWFKNGIYKRHSTTNIYKKLEDK